MFHCDSSNVCNSLLFSLRVFFGRVSCVAHKVRHSRGTAYIRRIGQTLYLALSVVQKKTSPMKMQSPSPATGSAGVLADSTKGGGHAMRHKRVDLRNGSRGAWTNPRNKSIRSRKYRVSRRNRVSMLSSRCQRRFVCFSLPPARAGALSL